MGPNLKKKITPKVLPQEKPSLPFRTSKPAGEIYGGGGPDLARRCGKNPMKKPPPLPPPPPKRLWNKKSCFFFWGVFLFWNFFKRGLLFPFVNLPKKTAQGSGRGGGGTGKPKHKKTTGFLPGFVKKKRDQVKRGGFSPRGPSISGVNKCVPNRKQKIVF